MDIRTNGPLFQKVDCLQIPVPDLEAGLAFYRDRLGHELIWRTNTSAGLRISGSEAEIVIQTERPELEVNLTVASTDEAVVSITRAGGRMVVAPFDIPIGRCAVVEDPWGNRLVLLDNSKGLLLTDAHGQVLVDADGKPRVSPAATPKPNPSLTNVYEGWDSHQLSLVRAIAPLSTAQLTYRPTARLRSVGEIASHISRGRISWFERMQAPGSAELAVDVAQWEPEQAVVGNAAELVRRLEITWHMIQETLTRWTVSDLAETYQHVYWGKTYAISRQWTIWRILAHDLHHGGELAMLLGLQGIEIPELGDLGGHLTEPPLAEDAAIG